MRARAAKVVPSGMYGHLAAASLPAPYPQFFRRGRGCRIWDVDDNAYIDFMCSWGPIVLGHRDPSVESAVARQMAEGDCLDGPTPAFVELAETVVATVPHADWAMFAKNGTDATTLAVRIARAATGRDRVLMAHGAYHGVASWCSNNKVGLTPAEQADVDRFDYNDLASVEAAAATGAEVAAIVLTPMRHDVRRDLEQVDPAFARGVRRLCDRIGAALVLDDVRCGMRFDLGGSWEPIGVRPDLSAWSKAIANGYPLAMVVGSDALRDAAGAAFATGSFWFGAAAMAAALATFQVLREGDGIAKMAAAGTRLRAGLEEQAASRGFGVRVSGPPQMPLLSFDADDASRGRAETWAAACIERGAFFHPHHNWFLGAAHGERDIEEALLASDAAFAVVREIHGDG